MHSLLHVYFIVLIQPLTLSSKLSCCLVDADKAESSGDNVSAMQHELHDATSQQHVRWSSTVRWHVTPDELDAPAPIGTTHLPFVLVMLPLVPHTYHLY